MTIVSLPPATLLFGYGNPGRGDDGVGPALIEAMQKHLSDHDRTADIECLTDMQLQIEHITDMVGRERILFIDADMSCEEACSLRPLLSEKDDSYTSHAMSPGALIYTYQQIYGTPAPASYVLSIRTYHFELGDDLCEDARQNLCLAIEMAKAFCDSEYTSTID
ncbi:MAG: hydrogenase maturation protease [Mariprofundus sp.]|nr:hydrogenase maturation protease [Mariprofundus sp.]